MHAQHDRISTAADASYRTRPPRGTQTTPTQAMQNIASVAVRGRWWSSDGEVCGSNANTIKADIAQSHGQLQGWIPSIAKALRTCTVETRIDAQRTVKETAGGW